MLASLKNHPFAVQAHFDRSLVLAYAVPGEDLSKLLPPCLTPDLFDGRLGFLAAAMVRTKALRPKGFPKFLGNDFLLIGYRIFVNYVTSEGKRLRGLYILGSETDKATMAFMGNIFTHYHYQQRDMRLDVEGEFMRVENPGSGLQVKARVPEGEIALPEGSPFKDWKEARRFAGPLPFTFTYDAVKQEVLIIEGLRDNWTPRPVEVLEHRVGFFDQFGLSGLQLANAFLVQDIPYEWKKGRRDPWKG